jgi:alpha-beta hydrolase superfamily lysophospholipase
MRLLIKIVLLVLAAAGVSAGAVGWAVGPGALHPQRRPLSLDMVQGADRVFALLGATREDFEVRAPDGAVLRGWKVRPASSQGDWVMLFHGVSDNRAGTLDYAQLLLRHGFNVVMMDARSHGESDGSMATFGWLERRDTKAVVDAIESVEHPHCLFALGASMGAAIALQSAGFDRRIEGVVAESSFRNLREVSYDYAGLHWSPLLGKTLFRLASTVGVWRMEHEGGFNADEVSPERAVGVRPFPVLLICDARDVTIPSRHSEAIYAAAAGPKQLWIVPGAGHTGAFGTAPSEFEFRVVKFFEGIHSRNNK